VELLQNYMVMGEEHRIACALWLAHTYAPHVAFFSPYLHIYSPVRECGKTNLLTLLESLARRAIKADSMSPAAMYRIIERQSPTLLLDELDTLLKNKDAGERVRGVLNSGFRRDGRVILCEGDSHEVREFPTYCPKALAGIGDLWDTVASRSIAIQLDRATAAQRLRLSVVRGDRIKDQLEPLRLQVARFAHDTEDVLADSDPAVPEALGARAADIWRPLLAIADAAGDEWPGLARLSAVALSAPRAETDWGVMLLEDVANCVIEDPTRVADGVLRSAVLLEFLHGREDRPWPTFGFGDKPMNLQRLASLLRRFEIRPSVHRVGAATVRGYAWVKLRAAITRYTTLQRENSLPVTDVTELAGVGGVAA
jgi:hypothetical protein